MADDSSPIKVEASAKIEIKTEIPSDASGRLAHAVADAVSPITELLGMAGDAVRTARIHRRIVAAKVIREAEAQLEFSGAKVHPVPLKIAVPLLEHASQEEPDDDIMIRLWAQLLASSASSEAVSPRFVSLLSEMNKRQVLLLVDIFNFEENSTVDLLDHCNAMVHSPLALNAIEKPSPHVVTSIVEAGGPALLSFDTVSPVTPDEANTKFKREALWEPDRQRATDLGILESLGLLRFGAKSSGYFPDCYVAIEVNQGACTALTDELLYLVGEANPEE